jgi:hypothetical protein
MGTRPWRSRDAILCPLRQHPMGLFHPDRPWIDSLRDCECGAPGEPCPVCNQVDEDHEPELPEGFEVENRRKVRDYDDTDTGQHYGAPSTPRTTASPSSTNRFCRVLRVASTIQG